MNSKPAKFLLKNSKGHPDFVMTMLVAVILCLFVVLLYWMMLNLVGLHLLTQENINTKHVEPVSNLLANFNQNSQIIIIGICSSVFSLAGSYYLRRASYDKHYVEKLKLEQHQQKIVTNPSVGLEGNSISSVGHPNFDDEEEDI
ncbi:MAG: hypothetical protein MI808_00110 [Pseudomonadales bacterium]|nr:hypothetical protein [Pseudomonadales bacterium]